MAAARKEKKNDEPRVLFIDIETAPILAHVWSIWNQNVGLNQIARDWSVLSFAAKWLGEPKVIYHDVSKQSDFADDRAVVKAAWKLLDEADVVVTQNGVNFDRKKLNARFAIHQMKPPSPFRMMDTKIMAKKVFAFTSNRLEYLSAQLNRKHRKEKHEEFSGFELWDQCMKGNRKAWSAMRKYNMADVLALEELFEVMRPWDPSITWGTYSHDGRPEKCQCGSTDFCVRGWHYTNTAKYRRYSCKKCGTWTRGRTNEIDAEARKHLKVGLSHGGSK